MPCLATKPTALPEDVDMNAEPVECDEQHESEGQEVIVPHARDEEDDFEGHQWFQVGDDEQAVE